MFARSILAVSLSIFLVPVVNAETAAPAPLAPIPEDKSIPIESYSLSLQAASPAVDNIKADSSTTDPSTDDVSTAPVDTAADPIADVEDAAGQGDNTALDNPLPTQVTSTATPSTTETSKAAAPVEWTLDALNNAEWREGLERGYLPVYAKAQVLLNRKHASPGAIDSATGLNTLKAVSTYQTMQGLTTDGTLNLETWESLNSNQTEPVFVEYTVTEADLKGPYVSAIPANYAEQAKMKGLYYTRVTEMLGEKFHMDENFLKKINPKASFKKAGETIIVANVRNNLPEDIHLIIAHKGAKQLYLFNSKNKMIASFPATIGSSDTPSPDGTHTVKNVAPNPWYGYSPKNFIQGGNTKPLSLPPGPNNPVGNVWIGLSKPSFGIHGTPNPSLISKTASHGCIRLTNWDANDLAKRVKPGITVKFLD